MFVVSGRFSHAQSHLLVGASAAKPHMVLHLGFLDTLYMDVLPTDLIQHTCTCALLSKIEEELLV